MTTDAQAQALRDFFPELELLVQPNGYSEVTRTSTQRRHPTDELRIGHFGHLYRPRVDVTHFLLALARSCRWTRVVFQQYGRDEQDVLRKVTDAVTVEMHGPLPWHEVTRRAAAELDIALVIGNTDPRQLPSKAIEYQTIPVPRLALTSRLENDALAAYARGKAGWLTISADDPEPSASLADHILQPWTAADLAPPIEESWTYVAPRLSAFVLDRLELGREPQD